MLLLFLILGVGLLIFSFKKASFFIKMKRGIPVSGTVKSVYTKNISLSKSGKLGTSKNAALVEFDIQSLLDAGLPMDFPPTEIITGKVSFSEGDSIVCMLQPDSSFITPGEVLPLSTLVASFVMSLFFITLPILYWTETWILRTARYRTFFVALLFSGIFVLIVSIRELSCLLEFFKGNLVKAYGEITEVRINKDQDGNTSYGYTYSFYYNGKNYKTLFPHGYQTYSKRNIPKPGDPVTVYFNKKNEDFMEDKHFADKLLYGTFWFVIGAGILFIIFPAIFP